MAKFLGNALQLLSRVYPLTGTGEQQVDRLDMGSPIQLVHNVSREVEASSGLYLPIQTSHEHAAVDTNVFSALEVNDMTRWGAALLLNPGNPNFTQAREFSKSLRAWLCSAGGETDNVNLAISEAYAVIEEQGRGLAAVGTAVTHEMVLYLSTQTAQPFSAAGGEIGMRANNQAPQDQYRAPRFLEPGTEVLCMSRVSAGAGAGRHLHFNFRIWVGPTGVLPPGLA